MRLGDKASGVDLVVHHHQRAQAASSIGGGDSDGGSQVSIAFIAEVRGGAHGAGEGHRLVAGHGQVEEVSRFLHHVGAVGHDDAVHFRTGQGCGHALLSVQTVSSVK